MRKALFALCLTFATASMAMAQDDSPLFGSEGSGVIRISLQETQAKLQKQASLDDKFHCTTQDCPHLQNAAMAAAGEGTQP